ncbi:MAG: CpaE family protein [Actinomycetota bacterium]
MRSVVVLGPGMQEIDLQQALVIGRSYPGTTFVHATDEVDVDTLQRAMRHGIREVISVRDTEADLAATIERAAHALTGQVLQTQSKTDVNGKVVAFFGTKGGTGKTLVATNLAVLSATSGVRTALLDASVRFGDCATFLRVRPDKTLTDLVRISGPIDEVALGSVLTTHDSGLRLLCSPNDRSRRNPSTARC